MMMISHSKQNVIDKWKAIAGTEVGKLKPNNLYDEIVNLVNDKPFTPINFPIIQRVSAMTLGQQLVGVQPMSAPTGVINYLDYKYGTDLFNEIIELSYENV
jgi:hypothetical protein